MPMWYRKKTAGFVAGFLGSLGLVLFYFLVTALVTRNWEFPLRQFWDLKFLMGPLVVGFGVQVGLFSYLHRHYYHATVRGGSSKGRRITAGVMGGNAGISGLTMVACCAHHLTEILPIIGFSGFSLFLVSYQKELLTLGVASNLFGIFLITRDLKKS